MENDIRYMQMALAEAQKSYARGEVPALLIFALEVLGNHFCCVQPGRASPKTSAD